MGIADGVTSCLSFHYTGRKWSEIIPARKAGRTFLERNEYVDDQRRTFVQNHGAPGDKRPGELRRKWRQSAFEFHYELKVVIREKCQADELPAGLLSRLEQCLGEDFDGDGVIG